MKLERKEGHWQQLARPALLGFCALAMASAVCAGDAPAPSISRADYAAQRLQIQHKYATDKDNCFTLQRQLRQRHACELQAKADYDLARKELRAQYRPTSRNLDQAHRAQEHGEFAVKAARCDDLRGAAKRLCVDEARGG